MMVWPSTAAALLLLQLSCCLGDALPRGPLQRHSLQEQTAAASALVKRLLPDRAHLFNVFVDPSIGPELRDTFHIVKGAEDVAVNVTGTSGVAAAWGLHHYLTQLCGCHVSWDYDQLRLPAEPQQLPAANITITSVDRYRYYQNVCTTSYSFVWWDWARWERELDWMALNGINMALAFTGQEAVWRSVWLRLGMSQQELDHHFTGPAFLAWMRMGNMRGWAGPLTRAWHRDSVDLQHRILARMRLLGILPVLPAFAGHVPRAFKRLFPNSSTVALPQWNRFSDEYCCPLLLDPTDPLFRRIGSLFTRELIGQFGSDHVFNSDPFNEMDPADGRPEYLAQVGRSIFDAIADVDPKAIWMIQNWMFVSSPFWTESRAKAFLTSVPKGRMLVLDLMGELNPQFLRLRSYYGQPFIWCMLHNFGGTLGLYGAITNVNRNVFEARAYPNGSMVGTGLTMEGTGQNYVMYDFVNDLAWRSESPSLQEWFTLYMTRRYGTYHASADKCWQLLKGSVYNSTDAAYNRRGKFMVTVHPTLTLKEPVWYLVEAVRDAWGALLDAAPALSASPNYRHDLVDLSRQGLQLAGAAIYKQAVTSFRKGQLAELRSLASQMLQVYDDLEVVLSTDRLFMLGPWLAMARQRATTPLEEQLYEWNARNQLTLWGPKGEIRDYAAKQWAGLMSQYYRPRWQRFLLALEKSLEQGTSFNQTAVSEDIFTEVEEPFTLDRTPLPTEPSGNTVEIARTLFIRWQHLLTTKAVVGRRTLQSSTGRSRGASEDPEEPENPEELAPQEPAVIHS